MKNKRRKYLAWIIVVTLLSPVYVYAGAEEDEWLNFEDISYVVDFLDYDGSFLDSRICAYGEKIEDVVTPERGEDERYVYEFAGWEPQFSETVTESVAYMALYHRIEKGRGTGEGVVSGPDAEAPPESSVKNLWEERRPGEKDQVSSTSYDVTPFHVETPGAEEDVPPRLVDESAEAQKEEPAPVVEREVKSEKNPPGKPAGKSEKKSRPENVQKNDVQKNNALLQENQASAWEMNGGELLPEPIPAAEMPVSALETETPAQPKPHSGHPGQAETKLAAVESPGLEAGFQEETRVAAGESGEKERLVFKEVPGETQTQRDSMKTPSGWIFLAGVALCGGGFWARKRKEER